MYTQTMGLCCEERVQTSTLTHRAMGTCILMVAEAVAFRKKFFIFLINEKIFCCRLCDQNGTVFYSQENSLILHWSVSLNGMIAPYPLKVEIEALQNRECDAD